MTSPSIPSYYERFQYDRCPNCGFIKKVRSKTCWDCRYPAIDGRFRSKVGTTYDTCLKCGGVKKLESSQCIDCRFPRVKVSQPDDPSYRVIQLTKGKFTLVDAEDYERLNAYRWLATFNPTSGHYYAHRTVRVGGSTKTIIMAREIMGLSSADNITVDHRNPFETLDNRKSNLRLATSSQQAMNQRLSSRNKTGFKGVSWDKSSRKFVAVIGLNNKLICLGRFLTPEAASEAYKQAAIEYHGEFARTE